MTRLAFFHPACEGSDTKNTTNRVTTSCWLLAAALLAAPSMATTAVTETSTYLEGLEDGMGQAVIQPEEFLSQVDLVADADAEASGNSSTSEDSSTS